MANDIRELLKKYDGQWKQAEPMSSKYTDLPDGTYEWEIAAPQSGILLGYDKDGAARARFVLRTLAPKEFENKPVTKSYTLVDREGNPGEIGMRILKGDLQLLGADCTDLSGVATSMQSVLGSVVQGTVKTKDNPKDPDNPYVNIYINKMLSAPGAKPAAAPASVPPKKKL